ncbi:MAG: hypothetical protein ACYDDN_03795 [Candidatus Desulforudaceae bacterium]
MEAVVNKAVAILKASLNAKLVEVDAEYGGGLTTPTMPADNYYLSERDRQVNYPAVKVEGLQARTAHGDEEWDEWEKHLEIEVYITHHDPEVLARLVYRYAEALKRVLRDPDAWAPVAHEPRIQNIYYSRVAPLEQRGFLRACRVALMVNKIQSYGEGV